MSPRDARTPIVVVTGAPASGKTTLARAVAETARVPLIEKDAIKELLFDALGVGGKDWNERLGAPTYALLYRYLEVELRASRSLVVEANFQPSRANPRFRELASRFSFEPLQIVCVAPAETLALRYAKRAASRHPGHADAEMEVVIAERIAAGEWGPLDLGGTTLTLDTSAGGAPTAVAAAVRHLRGASAASSTAPRSPSAVR